MTSTEGASFTMDMGHPAVTELREWYHAFLVGWTDGAKGGAARATFAQHKTRPDLTKMYLDGFDAGRLARTVAAQTATARTGHAPSVLRDALCESDDGVVVSEDGPPSSRR